MGGFDMHKVLAICFGVAATALAAGGASANDEQIKTIP
jgi:hypothetical protein